MDRATSGNANWLVWLVHLINLPFEVRGSSIVEDILTNEGYDPLVGEGADGVQEVFLGSIVVHEICPQLA